MTESDAGQAPLSEFILQHVAVTMEIDAGSGWLLITLTGDLKMTDLIAFMGEMQQHPEYSDDLSGLIDCRGMTSVLDIKEVRGLADLENRRPGPPWRSRRAVLVGSGEHYSLSRMFMMFAESSPVQYDVFYNYEAAMEWLKGGTREDSAAKTR